MYNNDPKYTDPPEAGLASLLASRGQGGDSMVVHMAPEEVSGLQQLARSMGAQESDLYNPLTGQPQFSFLKKILPQIAGAVLTGGFGMNPFTAAATVGAVTGLVEGDLQKGLMAGLGAYSGANIAGAFKAAGTPAAPVETPSTVKTAPPPTPQFAPTSTKDQIMFGGKAPTMFDVDPLARQNWAASNTGAAAVQAQTTVKPPTSNFGAIGQGIRNVFTGQEGASDRFMKELGGPMSRFATFAGASIPFAEEPKPINVPGMGEDIVYIPGGFNPQYGTGADQPYQLPGRYYKRTAKGMVPHNPFQMAPGARGFADGGEVVGVSPEEQIRIMEGRGPPGDNTEYRPLVAPVGVNATTPLETPATREDPNVAANRAYVQELNRRAMNPVVNPYGMNFAGGLGGTNAPWTGTNPYGGPLTPPPTQQPPTGGGAGDVAAFLATQVGINWMMQPGNAAALRNWISSGMKWADRPFLNAEKTGTGTGTGTGTDTGTNTGNTQNQNQNQNQNQQNQNQNQNQNQQQQNQQQTGGEGQPRFDPVKNIVIAGGTSAAAIAAAKALAAKQGLLTITLMDGTVVASGAGAAGAATGAAGAAGAATGATGATTGAAGGTAAGGTAAGGGGSSAAGASALKGGATPLGTTAAGLAALYGAHQAYEGIRKGKEGQAAAGGALAGAGGAYLAGASGLGGAGLTSLAGFGPVGLAAAAVAAIGASLVNTKEQGDVALRNYWKAVDQGRGIGSAPPEELANGFINFYRTNKNEFAGQEKYGRKGNEDFVYDMTQVVNKAVQDGTVSKDATPEEIYQKAVQPWLNSMGSGPKDADARRIQDFMMTDLIYNFMQGKPISNAQVKGDKKFKIVSERPVYAGNAPAGAQQTQQANTQGMGQDIDPRALADFMQAQNPYGIITPFADGGAVGDDYNFGFAGGGMSEYKAGGKLLDGPGDGMSDDIPAVIRGKGVQRAALADGEFVIPADVVSHLGNGSTKAGAKKLYQMMAQVRKARTGKTRQAPAVKTDRLLPA
jgi:hypothetical protein